MLELDHTTALLANLNVRTELHGEDREPAVNGEEGRRSLAVVQAVYESARTGREALIRTGG